jgi:hypothetical protein
MLVASFGQGELKFPTFVVVIEGREENGGYEDVVLC